MTFKFSALGSIAALAVLAAAPTAMADDVAAGKKLMKKCAACHSLEDGKNKVGPSLYQIVGRTAGTVEKYKYGKSIIEAGEKGLVWNDETLDGYLENPKKFLRAFLDNKKAKSKMSFKLKKEKQRKQVIAYLNSVSGAE